MKKIIRCPGCYTFVRKSNTYKVEVEDRDTIVLPITHMEITRKTKTTERFCGPCTHRAGYRVREELLNDKQD